MGTSYHMGRIGHREFSGGSQGNRGDGRIAQSHRGMPVSADAPVTVRHASEVRFRTSADVPQ
jgi:hypothetical protein